MPYIAPDRITEPLYVVAPIFNPVRWKSRWKLYQRFAKHVVDSGAILYTIEAAFGEREHALVDVAPHKEASDAARLDGEHGADCKHDDPRRAGHRYIRMRVKDELWLKENLINVAVSHLPSDWRYVAWIDADTMFTRPNWVGECIHQLQHYAFLQMFSHAQDVGPDYRVLSDRPGFIAWHLAGGALPTPGYYYGGQREKWAGVYSGLAWACTRSAWDHVGGLLDVAIHGGGDWHMAFALVGQSMLSLRKDVTPAYRRRVQQWQDLCDRHIRRNVGFMSGTITHFFHGLKENRRYADRHQLLALTRYDPDTDLKRDAQGLYQLVDDGSERAIWLRDGLRMYARMRNEDSNDA